MRCMVVTWQGRGCSRTRYFQSQEGRGGEGLLVVLERAEVLRFGGT